MLKELRIKNYAIIDELNIDFKSGLNILTGETGAGKSIIIESLGLILGERASDESIRSGEDSAAGEADYDILRIKIIKEKESESGNETEDNEIIIRRQISRSGKNRSYINNSAVNLSLLKDIGDMLVDIHGQHEHQPLLHPENHSIVLDLFGNILPLREKCMENYSNLQNLQREVNELINKERERVQKIDLLNFQKEEIDKAELNTDEDEELKREKNLIQNAERLHRYATESYDILYSSEGSVTEKLNTVITAIGELSRIDSSTERILNDGREVLFQIEDLASRIRDYSDKIEFNPNRLSEIDDRLAEITALKRKYGANIEDILNYRKKIDEDLEILSKSQERMDRLTTEIEKLKKEMEDTLMKLTREREKASKIASGGELSRVMLSIKNILTNKDSIPVLIFDEVDAGIGGGVAEVVGEKLKKVSKGRQGFCITHP